MMQYKYNKTTYLSSYVYFYNASHICMVGLKLVQHSYIATELSSVYAGNQSLNMHLLYCNIQCSVHHQPHNSKRTTIKEILFLFTINGGKP